MRVVMTGGTGLVGRAFAAHLVATGRDVVVLTRSARAAAHLPAGARWAIWDGRSSGAWVEEVDGAEALVNLAGENIASGRWTARRKAAIVDSRLRAARTLATAVARVETRPRVLLQASAVGFYGDRGDEVLTEGAAPGGGFLAETTVAWEEASAAIGELGVRRVLLRTGIVLARDGGALPKMALPFRLFAGGPLAGGRAWLPWIHVADEVGAMDFLLAHPDAEGPFNLAAPEPVTNREFARQLGRALRRPSLLPTPRWALELALGELATAVLASVRAIPDRLVELGYPFRYPRLALALADLLP